MKSNEKKHVVTDAVENVLKHELGIRMESLLDKNIEMQKDVQTLLELEMFFDNDADTDMYVVVLDAMNRFHDRLMEEYRGVPEERRDIDWSGLMA